MNRTWGRTALLALGLAFPLGGAAAQPAPSVEARVWLDRGDEPVVQRGDRVRVYYRTTQDGYLSLFHIDTNGTVRLLFPSSPDADHFVRGGRDYRLLFPRASYWFVDEEPGVGYFFALASPEPLDFRDFRYSRAANGWDLSLVGRTVYDDPFVAMDEYIARLIPDWEYADYALDWVEYDVGGRHDYPRFLCYDCHGFQPYSVWNPYLSACTSFRVVIYDDPWYYPVNRYVGTRVVYVRPPVWRQPRYVFTERERGDPWTPVVRPRPSGGGQPGIPGDPAPRRSGAGIGSGGTVPPVSARPGVAPGAVPLDGRTRPSAVRPSGTQDRGTRPTGSPGVTPRSGTSGTAAPARPTLQRRPSGGSTAAPSRSSGSSGGTVRATPRTSPTGTARPPSGGGGGTVRATPPRSSGSSGAVRSVPRSSGSSGSVRTPPRSSGSSGAVRSVPRSSGSSGSVRTPPRSSGSSGSVRSAPPRSSGGSVTRAPARTAPARAPARSSAGSSRPPSGGSPPARTPPPRRKPGGGNQE